MRVECFNVGHIVDKHEAVIGRREKCREDKYLQGRAYV
jgi:hypothetical protein